MHLRGLTVERYSIKNVYEAIDWEPEKEDDLYTPNNECSAKKWLEIKQDSQVMLIKNLNRSLVRCKTFAFL